MLMQLQQKKGEKVESNEKENFKKLLGNLQMQFESLIEKWAKQFLINVEHV